MWKTRFAFGGLMLLIGGLAAAVGIQLDNEGHGHAILPMIFGVGLAECLFVGFWLDAENENYDPSVRGAEGRRRGGL